MGDKIWEWPGIEIVARFLWFRLQNMSTYKLTYFPARARAEVVRFVFTQAEVKYEDVRITEEQWPELKPRKAACNDLDQVVVT